MRSAVTISLVEQARGGPFVFWDDLAGSAAAARELGFDAIEVFAPGPDAVAPPELARILDQSGLRLAAVGTGGGWVIHKLTLTSPDPQTRQQAREFIRRMIDFGGACGAPAIIGSMQGRWGEGVSREMALGWLGDAIADLAQHAAQYQVPLIYEPLNRYETNLVNTIDAGVEFLDRLNVDNALLLADLFHMNIEETDSAAALRRGGRRIGHVHFVDSNRRPAGCGQIPFGPIIEALRGIDYQGYLSAEAFPWPDPRAAAAQTISAYRSLVV